MSIWGKITGIVICIGVGVWALFVLDIGRTSDSIAPILTYEKCVSLGTVSDALPKICTTPDGRVFTEPETNEEALIDIIRLTTPRPTMRIRSPLVIEGFARGGWFFEGTFRVKLLDSHGKVIASAPAYAQTEWTTPDFVPFRAELTFSGKPNGVGKLVLEKDNPSGDPERDQSLTMLLHFLGKYTESVSTTTKASQ